MAHKKKINQEREALPYTIKDAMEVTDDVFKLSKEKKYNPGAFVHGLIFALEYVQYSYNIPHQQIADIKRSCRKYLKEIASERRLNGSS